MKTREEVETQEAVETQESEETLEEEATLEAVELQPEGLYRQIIRIRVMKKGKERKLAKITMMKNQMDMVLISMGAQVSTDMVLGRRREGVKNILGSKRGTENYRATTRSTDMEALKTKNTRPQRRMDMGTGRKRDMGRQRSTDTRAGRTTDMVASEI